MQGVNRLVTLKNGIGIAFLHYQGKTNRSLIFSHATGFCKEVWIPLLEELRKRGNEDEVILIDQRNHSDSQLANWNHSDNNQTIFHWETNARDLIEFLSLIYPPEVKKKKEIFGIGHSGGGAAMTLATIFDPTIFTGFIGIEPIIFAGGRDLKDDEKDPTAMLNLALKRRRHFPSKEEALKSFQGRGLFKGCDPRVLQLYVEHGLRPADKRYADKEETGFVLKCPPEREAATFRGGILAGILDRVHEVPVPMHVLFGGESSTMNEQSVSFMIKKVKKGSYKLVPETGHLLTFQKPALLAFEIFDWLEKQKTTKSSL